MVDVGRQPNDSLLLTLNTERMRFKDPGAKALPLVAVAASCRTACAFRPVCFSLSFHLSVTSTALFEMRGTILLTERYRLTTAGILADR